MATQVGHERTFGGVSQGRSRPVRAGVIGLGFIGEVHVRAIRAAGGTLAAVADASPATITETAERLGARWGAPSAEALIGSPDVDVVHICTPNHLHAPLARMAIEAGKHVVCEKPLATTVSDAQDLVGAARAAGVVAAVPFIYRYYPTVQEARARVGTGAAGSVRLIHGSYLQDWLSTRADQNWRGGPAPGGGPPPLPRHRGARGGTAAGAPRPPGPPAPSPTSACTGVTWSSSPPATGSPHSPRDC